MSSHRRANPTQLPLCERRRHLEELVAGSERLFPVAGGERLEAWEQVLAAGYAGWVGRTMSHVHLTDNQKFVWRSRGCADLR